MVEIHSGFLLEVGEKFYSCRSRSGPSPMDEWRVKDGFLVLWLILYSSALCLQGKEKGDGMIREFIFGDTGP